MVEKEEVVKAYRNPEELSKDVLPLYIINDYMTSFDKYKEFQERIYTIIKGCFEWKHCREYPVRFKFYLTDKEEHTMQLRHFVVNVFSWYPFTALGGIDDVMDESFIIDCFHDMPYINDYVNEFIITTLREYSVKSTIINHCVSDMLYNLRRISIDFSAIMNLTLSAEHFLDVYRRVPRMREIMETTFPLDKQPAEIEAELNKLMEEEIEIFESLKDNPVGVMLRAKTGIKHKQLSEFTIHGGLKPDLSGVTIPLPINSNTMIRGLDKPSSLYLDSLGARKSLRLIIGDLKLCELLENLYRQ